jgi:hypothetical protein
MGKMFVFLNLLIKEWFVNEIAAEGLKVIKMQENVGYFENADNRSDR